MSTTKSITHFRVFVQTATAFTVWPDGMKEIIKDCAMGILGKSGDDRLETYTQTWNKALDQAIDGQIITTGGAHIIARCHEADKKSLQGELFLQPTYVPYTDKDGVSRFVYVPATPRERYIPADVWEEGLGAVKSFLFAEFEITDDDVKNGKALKKGGGTEKRGTMSKLTLKELIAFASENGVEEAEKQPMAALELYWLQNSPESPMAPAAE